MTTTNTRTRQKQLTWQPITMYFTYRRHNGGLNCRVHYHMAEEITKEDKKKTPICGLRLDIHLVHSNFCVKGDIKKCYIATATPPKVLHAAYILPVVLLYFVVSHHLAKNASIRSITFWKMSPSLKMSFGLVLCNLCYYTKTKRLPHGHVNFFFIHTDKNLAFGRLYF